MTGGSPVFHDLLLSPDVANSAHHWVTNGFSTLLVTPASVTCRGTGILITLILTDRGGEMLCWRVYFVVFSRTGVFDMSF